VDAVRGRSFSTKSFHLEKASHLLPRKRKRNNNLNNLNSLEDLRNWWDSDTERGDPSRSHHVNVKKIKPKSENQSTYIEAMTNSDVILCSGPAGSGKTAVAVGFACQYLMENKVEKIVIARPTIESGRGLGHLPGTYTAKIQPYLVPVLEEMNKYFSKEVLHGFRHNNTIELCPLEYMRGRNFHNSFMILDEAQNATMNQIKMFITRIGRHSKAVLNGDPAQCDLDQYMKGGFDTCMTKLEGLEGISVCRLEGSDIVRNDIIARILSRLGE
jgi:phosphate starvation-inducible PhoH-like protein